MKLDEYKQFFAEELQMISNLQNRELIHAFATVPREHYLGAGPWQIWQPDPGAMSGRYYTTSDDDPKHLYHNVLVAIDAERHLNNGQPSGLAFWLEALELKAGDKVVHIGCGVGYYTAIITEVVGAQGYVIGVEIDANLAARAKANLAHLNNVEVINMDGSQYQPAAVDAIFVNAGVTHPAAVWLDQLNINGRLIMPLTFTAAINAGNGLMLKIKRVANGYQASFISQVGIYSFVGMRDEEINKDIMEAFKHGTSNNVQSIRRDEHAKEDSCWLHTKYYCISTLPLTD